MYAKGRNKSSKGTVQVKNSHGRLQLVFSHPVVTEGGEIKSKRLYFSTGEEDTSLGQKRAGALAATIQRDIDYGEFDASLDKYKPAASLSTVTPIAPTPETPPQLGLSELWEKYAEFKQPQLSQSTYAVDYRRYRNHIKKLPTNDLRDAN